MKNLYLLVEIFLISFIICPVTLTLSNRVVLNSRYIYLQDIVEENLPPSVKNIPIIKLNGKTQIISGKKILSILYSHQMTDVSIVGQDVKVYHKDYQPEKIKNSFFLSSDPISDLERKINSYLDDAVYEFQITNYKMVPEINLKEISQDYQWKMNPLVKGLPDILKLKNLTLQYQNQNYQVQIESVITGNVWFAQQSLKTNTTIAEEQFYYRKLDIKQFKDSATLVMDIEQAKNSQVIKNLKNGQVLRWSDLKKMPIVKRGENLSIKMHRPHFDITIPCQALEDGNLNEKIKVKLPNGKVMLGTVKKEQGALYVEI
ncbi:MAG: flagellar basal body P-ring formation chaperone FlgA [Spirochaetes bacterium]|nr:flagellar basal body P-ring formation chaperone FlgA [Spirochaetota bacterium]